MHIMNSWCLSAGIILLSNKSGILLIFSDHETIPSVSSNIGEQEGPEHSHKIQYNNVTAAVGGAKLFNFKQILEKLDKQKQ